MSTSRLVPGILVFALLLAGMGCDGQKQASMPPPQEPTLESTAEFCSMPVLEHTGPKGQIFLADRKAPLWFASVRDAIAFTLLPEEPKNITAIYVNDMGRASWAAPEPGTWVEAGRAWYVIGSRQVGGMTAAEVVPFAEQVAAQGFAARNGGRVVTLAEIPASDVLDGDAAESHAHATAPPAPSMQEAQP